jgi:hypothetical protein
LSHRLPVHSTVRSLGPGNCRAPHRVGFIAEEAADLGLAQWVDYDDEGPEAFSYGLWVVALQAIVQSQAARIDDLEARIAPIEPPGT